MTEKENIYTKQVTVRQIVEFFKYDRLTGDDKSLDRWTVVPDINRPGFELCGVARPSDPRRIVIIGNKESEYISHMSEQEQRERFPMLTDGLTPLIIITKGNVLPPILKEVAEKQNFPIVGTKSETYRVIADIISYLDEQLALEDTISGTLMSVYGKGVMLTGESGMGKSETALELIRNGHMLISDDRVDVVHFHNTIMGYSPKITKGLLEIRGIGIIDVEKMFGASVLSDRSQIDMVINLVNFDENVNYNRIGDEEDHYTRILGMDIPTIILPVSAGRNMRILIESAVTNFRLQKDGYHSSQEIKQRFSQFVGRNE